MYGDGTWLDRRPDLQTKQPSPTRMVFDARCRCSSAILQTSCWSARDHTNNTFKCPSEVGSMKLVGAEAGAPQSGLGGV